MNFDPTKTQPVKLTRPVAQLQISYDPNTGQLNWGSQGFLPVEELGVLQWVMDEQSKKYRAGADQKIKLATVAAIPPGGGRTS